MNVKFGHFLQSSVTILTAIPQSNNLKKIIICIRT